MADIILASSLYIFIGVLIYVWLLGFYLFFLTDFYLNFVYYSVYSLWVNLFLMGLRFCLFTFVLVLICFGMAIC